MAPPFLFTLRHHGYQAGCGVLLLATIMTIFGVLSPGWYSMERSGTRFYTHLWIGCRNGLRGCNFLSPSEMKGFQRATQAFALLGLMGLVTSCIVAAYLNFLTERKRHHHFLEAAILVSGGLAFLAGIIFVAGNSDYIESATAEAAAAAKPTDLEIKGGYAMALTFVGAILALAAGVVVWIFNRPLEIPSDERSLSDLRRADPVDRLHREARGRGRRSGSDGDGDEDEREFGFTNAALQMADEEVPAGKDDPPPSCRNCEPPQRLPGHVSRPVAPGADNMQNGHPLSVEQAAATGHPAVNIDRHNYPHRPHALAGWSPGVRNNPHHHPAANVGHHATPTTNISNNNITTGGRAGRDPSPRLDMNLDPPSSQPPPRHHGGGSVSSREGARKSGLQRGRDREEGGRRKENRDRYPPRGFQPAADDNDSALREIRNNEINAAASAAASRQQQQQQAQSRRDPRSRSDNGVSAVTSGTRDWQRIPRSQSQGEQDGEGRRTAAADDPHHRHRPSGRPHTYHDDWDSRGQQPRSASLRWTGSARGSNSHERPLPSPSSTVAARRFDEGSSEGHSTRKDRKDQEEQDVYADGDLGEPTPSYRQTAVKTWVTGTERDWSRAGAGGREGGGGRTGAAEGGRYVRGGTAVGSGERRPAAVAVAAVSDDRYVDDAHIYANVGQGYDHHYPSPQAPPSDHPHHPDPAPPDYRYTQSSSHSSSSERHWGRRQGRHERADPSDRDAPDSQNARRGRAYGGDDSNNDPSTQNTRRQNEYGGSGNDPTQADARDGPDYASVRQDSVFADTMRRRYGTEGTAYGNQRVDPNPDCSRPKNHYVNVIRHSDQPFSDAGSRHNNAYCSERGDQDRENARRKADYVHGTHSSGHATEGFPRRGNADEDRQRNSSVVMETRLHNPHGDARQSSDQQADTRRKQSYSDVGGSDDGARVLRLSDAGDVTETDVDNVADSFPGTFLPPRPTEI